MRAVILREFGGPDAPELGELPAPLPGPLELQIAVQAVAVNYVDLLVIGGKYQFLPERPFVPGKGPAGTVTAVGESVTRFKVGDRVLAMAEQGGYAEVAIVGEANCYRLPASMSSVDAAAFALVYDTSWFALRDRARYKPGETVLVLGASGAVGLAAVQLAKAMDAKVLAGVASPEKADMVRAAGADAVIDLSRADLRDSLRAEVNDVTGGHGADIILDPLGGDVFDAALRALAWRGRLVVIGFAAGRIPSLKANYLLLKNIEVSGLQVSDYRKKTPDQMAACFSELFAFYEAGKIKPTVMATFPLERWAEALRLLETRQARGRVVLTTGQ
jgi:NADPH2:quinone reductase